MWRAEIGPPIRQHLAVERRNDDAARREDDGMARGDVPLRQRRQARINVGCAFRDPTEFQRRSGNDSL